jgi:hypothetical protein
MKVFLLTAVPLCLGLYLGFNDGGFQFLVELLVLFGKDFFNK